MREIKFRGKRSDTGEWIFGDLLTSNRTECEISDWNDIVYSRYDVITETVGQFTGLHDKNGKEIYEGGILGRYTDNGQPVALSQIIYEDNGFYARSLISGTLFNLNIDSIIEKQTVIGNIHDNPELLSK